MNSNSKNKKYILDSFALLAYFENEISADIVKDLLHQALDQKIELMLCAINLGEIYYITYREIGKIEGDNCLNIINILPIHIITPDLELILQAAEIKAKYPISYADAFLVALGVKQNAIIVTGDPEFKRVENIISIKWLKQ